MSLKEEKNIFESKNPVFLKEYKTICSWRLALIREGEWWERTAVVVIGSLTKLLPSLIVSYPSLDSQTSMFISQAFWGSCSTGGLWAAVPSTWNPGLGQTLLLWVALEPRRVISGDCDGQVAFCWALSSSFALLPFPFSYLNDLASYPWLMLWPVSFF